VVDLLELSAEIRAGDSSAAAAARSGRGTPAGRLGGLAEWLAATTGDWPPPAPRVRLVHTAVLAGGVRHLAAESGVGTRHLAVRVQDVDAAMDAGVAAADAEVDGGTGLLLLAAGDAAPAAVITALLTEVEPVRLLPRGAAVTDSAAWIADATRLRDRLRAVRPLRHQPGLLLAELGRPGLAAACGFLLRAAARSTPLLLDGPGAVAAALLAADLRPRATQWWRVADTGPDAVQAHALHHLGDRPVLDLGTGDGSGLAALLGYGILRAVPALHRAEANDE